MVAGPPATPVTTPVALPAEAVADALLHAPPAEVVARVVIAPRHKFREPVMPAGKGFTVTALVTSHPAPSEYVIVTAPVTNPLTTPVVAPTDASTGLLLLHAPPAVVLLSVILSLRHTPPAPLIGAGREVTVTVLVDAQPVTGFV